MGEPTTEERIDALLADLHAPRVAVRRAAVGELALVEAPDRSLIAGLVAALGDPDVSVRLAVARALQQFAPAAVPVLLASLGEAEDESRRVIVRTLGMMGPAARAALPALARLADDPQFGA